MPTPQRSYLKSTAPLWPAIAVVAVLFLGVTSVMNLQLASNVQELDGAATGVSPQSTELAVELSEFAIGPAELDAAAGQPVVLRATNAGQAEHNIALDGGPSSPDLAAGDTGSVDLGALEEGTYRLLCTVPGHADAGMVSTLNVTQDGAAATADTGHAPMMDSTGHADMTPQEMVDGHNKGITDFVAAATGDIGPLTEGKGNQPLKPTRDGDVKVFDLTADEIDWEVAPGDVREAFAINGQVPGPRIDVNVGDTVRMVLHNELAVPTAIHPHGLYVPNDLDGVPGLTQNAVMPGESFSYEFTVRNAGTHMYHSHFDSAVQVPKGLLGAFVVHDTDEPRVDLDYTMVLNDGPLGYTLNGKGFPATEALVVKAGQKVRVRYMNEGLQIHPMHLHGMPQKVIAKDGWPLAEPRMEDTVLVAPGERVDVIIDASEVGAWAFHCHILNHAEAADGMFGMVTAMVVAE